MADYRGDAAEAGSPRLVHSGRSADQLASGDEGALTACNRLISSGNCHSCVLGMLSSLEVKVLCPT